MTSVKISIDKNEIERVNTVLAGMKGGAEKALYNAIGRGQAKVTTESKRAISSVYSISQQNIRASTNIQSRIYTTSNAVIGEVKYAGTKIPLYRFDVNPKVPMVDRQKRIHVILTGGWVTLHPSIPVNAKIKRGGQRTTSETAFIATMQSGHIGVFERVDGSNKIRERMGLATAQMMTDATVLEDIEKQAQETVTKRLEHEMTRILNGYK